MSAALAGTAAVSEGVSFWFFHIEAGRVLSDDCGVANSVDEDTSGNCTALVLQQDRTRKSLVGGVASSEAYQVEEGTFEGTNGYDGTCKSPGRKRPNKLSGSPCWKGKCRTPSRSFKPSGIRLKRSFSAAFSAAFSGAF